MQLRYEQFKIGHLRYLSPQAVQKYDHVALLMTDYADTLDSGFGMSVWAGNLCIAAGGVVPVFSHRAVAWAILSDDASPYMLSIVRKVRAYLRITQYRRVEMTVRADFEQGRRFAGLIGMRLETPEPLCAHGANGEDEFMYSFVKWQYT